MITLLVPTYSRVDICKRLVESVLDTGNVVATHFDNPTQFQIFKRFFIRGIKVAAGYTDDVMGYDSLLTGLFVGSWWPWRRRRIQQ